MKKRKLLVFAIIAVALIFLGGIYLNSDIYITHQIQRSIELSRQEIQKNLKESQTRVL